MDFERTRYFNELIFKLPIKPFKAINVSFMISIQTWVHINNKFRKRKKKEYRKQSRILRNFLFVCKLAIKWGRPSDHVGENKV